MCTEIFAPTEEDEEAVNTLKTGKSPGVDNIPSELLKNGGEATTTVLTAICQKIWETKEWPKSGHSLLSYLYQTTTTTTTKQQQPQALSELSYRQPNQQSQQDYAPSYPRPTQGQG